MKKVKKHLFLLTVALILLGCWIWKNQNNQDRVKADELNVIINSKQTELYAGNKYSLKLK